MSSLPVSIPGPSYRALARPRYVTELRCRIRPHHICRSKFPTLIRIKRDAPHLHSLDIRVVGLTSNYWGYAETLLIFTAQRGGASVSVKATSIQWLAIEPALSDPYQLPMLNGIPSVEDKGNFTDNPSPLNLAETVRLRTEMQRPK